MRVPKGRSTGVNLPNRFEQIHIEPEDEPDRVQTEYFVDGSKSILTENQSPDIGFRFSLNPYRGCEHGCIYCYARPTHEYLGFSAGLDFETKIIVKQDAAQLLRNVFKKKSWEPQVVALSGNTDCYQPVERKLRITRSCLEVFREFRNPVSMITKSHLVSRDVDILKDLAALNLVQVVISITSLRQDLASIMEPRATGPMKRIETIRLLSSHGIPVGVFVAPLIPGLNEEEAAKILKAAYNAGATWANYIILRLPGQVKALFSDWLENRYPSRKKKVLHALMSVQEGKLSDSQFGSRMIGTGKHADLISRNFELARKRLGFHKPPELLTHHFKRSTEQFELFS